MHRSEGHGKTNDIKVNPAVPKCLRLLPQVLQGSLLITAFGIFHCSCPNRKILWTLQFHGWKSEDESQLSSSSVKVTLLWSRRSKMPELSFKKTFDRFRQIGTTVFVKSIKSICPYLPRWERVLDSFWRAWRLMHQLHWHLIHTNKTTNCLATVYQPIINIGLAISNSFNLFQCWALHIFTCWLKVKSLRSKLRQLG